MSKAFNHSHAPPVIMLAGPTASGKSAIALKLASKINGVIVNVDSMQVYSDLRILTARPSVEEERQVPHYLYGHVDGSVAYSVADYLNAVQQLLDSPVAQERPLIFVGGTGLYFRALLQGLAPVPPIIPEIREKIRRESLNASAPELHMRLQKCDPDTAMGLKPQDHQRIVRALEVWEQTGHSLAYFQKQPHVGILNHRKPYCFFITRDRPVLIERINKRFDMMVAQGAIAEVEALLARSLDPTLPLMRAHGVPRFIAYLRSQISLADAIEQAKIETRQYAKRQMTWWRGSLPNWPMHSILDSAQDSDKLIPHILQSLKDRKDNLL